MISVTPSGDTVVRIDTLAPSQIDTVRTITPDGDTIYVPDTVYLPADTGLHWVGHSSLVITEVNPINLDWLDEDGDDGSWIEIYNAGSKAANLKGYSLIENTKNSRKWVFGDELLGAKSFRIVFCDKKDIAEVTMTDTDSTHARAHTNWKLDKAGGTIYLVDPYYGIRDSVAFPSISKANVSWGIVDGGLWQYFEKPTPEKPNIAESYEDVAPELDFGSFQAGFYDGEQTFSLPKLSDGVSVRCTQDGSLPEKSSPKVEGELKITKNTSLRCAVFKDGALSNQVVTKTFFIGETVQMPVVAISVDPKFFTEHYVKTDCDKPNGCKDSAALYQDKEYPVHVEYFENGSKTKGGATWEINAGIDLMGGWSRLNKKKSVKVALREEYEDGRINYSLFETRKKANDKYKAFNLRNNGNRFVSDYIEDAMAGAILEGSGVDYQRSRQVVVFYNGEYYGIHDMREHFNEHYVEGNYGIKANTVEMVKQLGSLSHITYNAGTDANYIAMLNFVGENDFSGENNKNYEIIKTMIDVGNYADYMAAQIYYHNGDWPNNNVRAWRSPEQPWKFMVYDVDHGFGWKWGVNNGEFSEGTNMFSWIKKGGGNKPCKETGCFANIYIQLIKNPDFERLFINRSAAMWTKNLNSKNVASVVDAMVKTIPTSEMDRDLEKYHQNEKGYPDGFDKTGSLLKSWASERDQDIVGEYQDEFDLGSLVSVKFATEGKGVILMEGRNMGTSYSGKFFDGMEMELQAVPTDGSVFSGWNDGVTDNPRIVEVSDGASFAAKFK